jgi:putative ABC transport system permease protein
MRLRPTDIARLGAAGVKARPLRAALSALGIAIGIGAMLAVVGISASSHAELDRRLAKLGTNLLTAASGPNAFGEPTRLAPESVGMVGRIGPVLRVAATAELDARVYRNDRLPPGQTGSIAVLAAHRDLPATVGASVQTGAWFNAATFAYPAVVLGHLAAQRLGLPGPGVRVWLGGRWFAVVGVLGPVPLAPELDLAALVGWQAAGQFLDFDGYPGKIYVRTTETQVAAVRAVLAATAKPTAPQEVRISRPSEALAAKQATDSALTSLLLGLGGVSLLVGGVGVANTMVVSVLERRPEIGLRRALGATRGHIRAQFLTESLLLSALGGAGGAVLGTAVTWIYATAVRGWPAIVPAWASAGALAATLVIGGIAGLYPAIRASRLAPTQALAAV